MVVDPAPANVCQRLSYESAPVAKPKTDIKEEYGDSCPDCSSPFGESRQGRSPTKKKVSTIALFYPKN